MLKQLLVVLGFFCTVAVFGQTLIPDANFEQFLVDEGIDNNGLTGDILNADAAAVTDLNITRNDITDFTGLEAFVNVVTLNLGQNLVATYPLNTLTLLEELNFARNTALTTLDLSQNLELRELIFNNDTAPPLLTVLDLSNNTKLENLNVRTVRSITSLTLPVTATLTDIYVANLSVPIIDLSQLTGDFNFRIVGSDVFVTIIYPNKRDALKNLELSSIDFPNVDVSEMIGLERFQLSSTFTENVILPTTNTLTNIGISVHELNTPISFASVPELRDLSITTKWDAGPLQVDVSQNPELTNLTLTNNNMLSIDVTQNPLLQTFRVYTNELTSLDVTQNLDLNRLEAYQNQLPGIDLSQNLDLQWLDLRENQIPSLDITNNTNLWSVNISNNLFTGTGLDLTQNIELRTFIASFNQIESLDITQNPELTFLTLNDNLFTGTDILDQFYVHYLNRSFMRVNLNVENNMLSGTIPDFFSPFPLAQQSRRNEILFSGNAFEFGDFETEHLDYVSLLSTLTLGASPDFVFRNYTYAPQEKVNAIETPVRNAGDAITLLTDVRGSQNHYTWFKDGVEIPDAADSPELILNNLNTCDAGVYHAEVTSDLVPFENADPPGTNGKNLLLVRNDITLTINATKTCVTLDMPLTDVPINSGIQWTDNPGACGYRITVRDMDNNIVLVNDEDVGEVTVYNYVNDFPPNTNIGVTITPVYDDGNFPCTELSFRTNATTTTPECTALLSPLNGSDNVAVNLSGITWNPANGADQYTVTVISPSGANDIVATVTDNRLDFSNDFTPGEVVTVSILPSNAIGNASGCLGPETFTIATGNVAPSPNLPFITTWETTTANESITIPTNPLETYTYDVDWGDGNVDTNLNGDATHSYTSPGVHTVEITGTFPAIQFAVNPATSPANEIANAAKILTIEQWGEIDWTTFAKAFQGCTALTITNPAIDNPNLTTVTNLSEAFRECTNFNGDITNWDVATITNMTSMFHDASSFDQNIGGWTVTNVISMARLFEGASDFNQNIGSWDVGTVTNMAVMFAEAAAFNQDIGSWNVSNVSDMNTMFAFATNFNQDIGRWNVTNVQNMNQMFLGASSFDQDISFKPGMGIPFGDAWNTVNLSSMAVMFSNASSFNANIGNWNVGNVMSMGQAFSNASSFDQDLSNWDVRNVTDAGNMFTGIALSIANYEALLIGWNAQNLQPNVGFGGGNSQFCSQAAADAKANMETLDMWIIADGGRANANLAFDAIADVNLPNTYTLPAILGANLTGNERYYTQTNGGGTVYQAGDVIQFADFPNYPVSLFVFDAMACTSPEVSFELTLTNAGVNADIFVDQAAPPGGDGTTWATAFQTIEEAVAVATGGNTIFIAQGTYLPPNTQTITVPLRFDGGYPTGGGIQDPLLNITQVQANANPLIPLAVIFEIGDSVPCIFTGLHFAEFGTAISTGSNLVVDQCVFTDPTGVPLTGIGTMDAFTVESSTFNGAVEDMIRIGGTITNVSLLDVLFTNGRRAALDLTDGSSIQNISLEDCAVTNFDANGNNIIDVRGTMATIENLLAEDNEVAANIALLVFGEVAGSAGTLALNNSTFLNNSGEGDVCMQAQNTILNMENTNFEDNRAIGGSSIAVMNLGDTQLTAQNCNFTNNSINDGPASIAQAMGSTTNWTFNSCEFQGNTATGSSASGLFQLAANSSLRISNSILDGNTGEAFSAISALAFSSITLENNTIRNHTTGGPIFGLIGNNTDTELVLTANNFSDNPIQDFELRQIANLRANGNTYLGEVTITTNEIGNAQFNNEMFSGNILNQAFLILETTNATFENCLMVSEKTLGSHNLIQSLANVGLEITNSTFSASNILNVNVTLGFNAARASQIQNSIVWSGIDLTNSGLVGDVSNLTINNSLIRGEGATVNGNLDGTDANNIPEFIAPANLNFQMLICSPTINQGQNNFVGLTEDLLGNPRIFETIVDLGAYEVQEPFDTNCDAPTIPGCTNLLTPVNLDFDIPVNTNLTWDVATDATGYRVRIGTESGEDDLFNQDVGNVTSLDLPNDLPGNSEIFVFIQPYNGDVDAEFCEEERFMTAAAPNLPICTSLRFPEQGSTDIALNTTLTWGAIGGIDGYLVSIGTVAGGNDVLGPLDVGLTTSYQPENDLPSGSELFVTITPFNTDGNAENCDSISFTTVGGNTETQTTLFGLSPDGDGINDFWTINGIEEYPSNTVTIYNRWGDAVFKISGYDNATNVFRGEANQLTGLGAGQLPEGTYFFSISLPENHNLSATQGYVVLKR